MNTAVAIHSADRTIRLSLPDPTIETPRRKSFMTQLADAANADTPAGVQVPATLTGLAQYIIGRWGPWGMILIGQCICLYLYVGQVAQTQKVLQDQVVQQQAQIQAMHQMLQTMDSVMRKNTK